MPISADRWRTLSPYLDEALEIFPRERAAWLEAIFARDAALAVDLQKLLVEWDQIRRSHFLEQSVSLATHTDLITLLLLIQLDEQ